MSLLSGLEKFGLGQVDTKDLFEDEKKDTEDVKKEEVQEKKEPVHTEEEFLLDKNVRCPVCDHVFRTRVVKTGRVKRLEPDEDLRPRFQYIDTNKYDVSSCPRCGYTAMNRYFTHLSTGQIKMIQEGVCSKFKPEAAKDEPLQAYSYDTAIERYELALYNTIVKKGKNSEKAYECLKLSWLFRGKAEELEQAKTKDEKQLAECRKQEMEYYQQAYEGLLKASASENFPMCGMEESTVNLLMANISFRLGKYDNASRFVSMILTSHVASRGAKDRAMTLKDQIIAKIHEEKA